MSVTVPDPSGGPHRQSHATVVLIDPATGAPVTPLADAGAKVTTTPDLGTGGTGIIGWLSQIWSAITGTLTVSGPLTDEQLRAADVPVSGPLTYEQLFGLLPLATNGDARVPAYGQEVQIQAGESYSSSFYSTGQAAIGAAVRGNWTGAVLTIQVCIEPTGTEWFDVFDDAGAEVVYQILQGQMAMWQGRPIHSPLIRLRSGTSAVPVPQVEACTFVILMAP